MKIRTEHKIIVLGFLAAVISWLADIVIDKIEFPEQSLIHIILYDAPTHIVFIRPTIAFLFIAFGILIAYYVTRIHKLEQRCHTIFDSVYDMILVRGPFVDGDDSKFIDANSMASQKLGYTKEELARLTLADLVVPAKLPEFLLTKCTKLVKSLYPNIKILILTMHKTKMHVTRALEYGADGYIVKEDALSELILASRWTKPSWARGWVRTG